MFDIIGPRCDDEDVRIRSKCILITVFCAFVLTWPPGTFVLIQLLTFRAHRDVMLHVCVVVHTTSLSVSHNYSSSNTWL